MPDEDVGAVADAGSVNVLYGSTGGLSSAGNQLWTRTRSGCSMPSRPATASARRWRSARPRQHAEGDLAIGVPDEDIGAVADAGSVNVLYGSPAGLADRQPAVDAELAAGSLDSAEAGDRFGAALACRRPRHRI